MKRLIDIIKQGNIFYAFAVLANTLAPYYPNDWVIVALSAIGIMFLFMFLDSFKEKTSKRMCTLAYFIALVFLIVALNFNIGGFHFYEWLLTGYDYDPAYLPYISIFYFIGLLFIGTTVYYFTKFYFRGYIMIFILMIPIALYFKMIETVKIVYIIMIVVSLIYIYISKMYLRHTKDVEIKKNSTYYRFLSLIFLIVILVAIITPKNESAKYRDITDEVISLSPFSARNLGAIGMLKDSSAAGSYAYLNQNRVIYRVDAFEPLYLRRSSYMEYSKGQWTNDEVAILPNWENNREHLDMRTFYETMTALYELCPEIFKKYDIALEDIPNVTEESMDAIIYASTFKSNFFLHTARTFNVIDTDEISLNYMTGGLYQNNENIEQKSSGSIQYGDKSSLGRSEPYEIKYYQDIARQNQQIIDFASHFTAREYVDFIEGLSSCVYENEELLEYRENVDYLKFSIKEVKYNLEYVGKNKNYSNELKKLALEITSDYDTEYEKAVALERYFSENGYEYTLDDENSQNSIEYFVFESKAGACGEYATAMTLMAQSIGLCAKYTEGFYMSKEYERNSYYITAGDSHAYVEMYIPGYGYTVFEPTVSGSATNEEGIMSGTISRFSEIFSIGNGKSIYLITAMILIVAVILVLYKSVVSGRLMDKYMVMRYKNSPEKCIYVYKHILRILKGYTPINSKSMTPNEIQVFVSDKYGIDIKELVLIIERRGYKGEGIDISSSDMKNYSRLCVELRRKIKAKDKEERKINRIKKKKDKKEKRK